MKRLASIVIVFLLVIACSKPDRTIALNKVGNISNETTIKDLKDLFKNDSIVSVYSEGDLGNVNDYVLDNDTHLIYAKGGELLLSISPVNPLDTVSKIKSITVFSDVYKTVSEIGLSSTFGQVNVNHTIEKLEATFNSITVFVKDINATFTMNKEEVGVKTFTLGTINKTQISDESKFTSFTIWLE